jgi:hypothetical protein
MVARAQRTQAPTPAFPVQQQAERQREAASAGGLPAGRVPRLSHLPDPIRVLRVQQHRGARAQRVGVGVVIDPEPILPSAGRRRADRDLDGFVRTDRHDPSLHLDRPPQMRLLVGHLVPVPGEEPDAGEHQQTCGRPPGRGARKGIAGYVPRCGDTPAGRRRARDPALLGGAPHQSNRDQRAQQPVQPERPARALHVVVAKVGECEQDSRRAAEHRHPPQQHRRRHHHYEREREDRVGPADRGILWRAPRAVGHGCHHQRDGPQRG